MIRLLTLLWLGAPAAADTVVALRTIPAQSVILATDIGLQAETIPGALSDPAEIVGMEARVALFPGRPIRAGDVSPPAMVERNQIITLHYNKNGLQISTEGRALDRAAMGEVIRVMNLSSRTSVSAMIGQDGAAYVQN